MPTWRSGSAAGSALIDGSPEWRVGAASTQVLIEDPVYASAGELVVGSLAAQALASDTDHPHVGSLAAQVMLRELDVEVNPLPDPPLGPPTLNDPPILGPEPLPPTPPEAPISYPAPGTGHPDIPTVDEWGPGQVPAFVEMAIGSPSWRRAAWTDFTRSLHLIGQQSITIKRGRPDEHGVTSPTTASVRLNATDGALMPDNPGSPFYPHWQVGTPMRISAADGAQALYLPGATGAFADSADTAAANVTTLDLRARLDADEWNTGISWAGPHFNLDRPQEIATKWGSGGQSWTWAIYNAGWPVLQISDGGTHKGGPVNALVAATEPVWLGVTLTPDGLTSHYIWRGLTDPPDDITAWDLLGTVDIGPITIDASTTPISIGARDEGTLTSFRGRVSRLQVRDGINGTIVADPDWSTATEGDTTITDTAGNGWTVQGLAAVTARRVRAAGEVVSIEPAWPARDHAAGKAETTYAEVAVRMSGPLRRLAQGQSPLRGAIYRHVTGTGRAASVKEYWPMTDGSQADRLASARTTGHMTITGDVRTAADSTLIGSEPLPTIEPGKSATIAGGVAGAGSAWAVDWFTRVGGVVEPEDGAPETFTELFRCATTGGDVTMQVSATTWRITIGEAVHDYALLEPWLGQWLLCRIESTGSTYRWSVIPLEEGVAYGLELGSGGTLSGVAVHTVGPPGGLSVGHICVTDLPLGWLAGADTAWVGESAAHRLFRLAMEEDVPMEIVGDLNPWGHSLRGDISLSEPMGPQRQATFLDLAWECVAADGGILAERRASPGLVYRTRRSMVGQAAQLTIDGAQNHLLESPKPRLDDQALRNDVEVAAVGGSSARAIDTASVGLSGRYDTSLRIVGVGGVDVQAAILAAIPGLADAVDTQNAARAAWELTLGTYRGMRWPQISVALDLMDPADLERWCNVEPGDLVAVANLPVQHPGMVLLIVQAITETVTPERHTAVVTCTPGQPWTS